VVTSSCCLVKVWTDRAFKEVFALSGEVRGNFWSNWLAMLPFEASLTGQLWQLEGRHAVWRE